MCILVTQLLYKLPEVAQIDIVMYKLLPNLLKRVREIKVLLNMALLYTNIKSGIKSTSDASRGPKCVNCLEFVIYAILYKMNHKTCDLTSTMQLYLLEQNLK